MRKMLLVRWVSCQKKQEKVKKNDKCPSFKWKVSKNVNWASTWEKVLSLCEYIRGNGHSYLKSAKKLTASLPKSTYKKQKAFFPLVESCS